MISRASGLHLSLTGISDVDDCSLRENVDEQLSAPFGAAIFLTFRNVSGKR